MIVRANASSLPFESGSFACAVTSPPYFGKVVYGDSDEEHGIGSLKQYLYDLRMMAHEVHRCLDQRGVFWLNIGDTFNGSGGAGGDHNSGGRKDWKPRYKQGHTGLVGSQHILVPQRVALMLQEDGWLVRRWIVWSKAPHVKPEDLKHVRRPLDQHETILMLAKHRTYRYRPVAHEMFDIPKGDVWEFAPERARTGHQAPFPAELPRRCILLTTTKGERVLDPYAGSGTTINVANELGRVGVGADLYARSEH